MDANHDREAIVAFGIFWARTKPQPEWGNDADGVMYGDPKALHIIVFCTGAEYHASLYYAEELPLENGLVGDVEHAVRTLETETTRRHAHIGPLMSSTRERAVQMFKSAMRFHG